jgi:flap endonuclease-1
MGVKGLYTYLKHYRNDIDPLTVPPCRVGIDAMSILYRYKANTADILTILRALKGAGHTLFFVFDGKPPVEKEREIQSRKDVKADATAQATAIDTFLKSDAAAALDKSSLSILEYSMQRAQHQSWHMTRDIRRAFQETLWNEEIPYVKSVSEADDVLTDLVAAGKLDVILTTDMDYLLGGVARLWIPTRKGDCYFEDIQLDDILSGEGITRQGLLDAGLLCGTEERKGAQGVPCATAFAWIRHYGSLEGLLKSSVADPVLRAMFPSVEAVTAFRQLHVAQDAYSRIRPDHLVRVREFLDQL